MKDFYNGTLEMEMEIAPESGGSDHRLLSHRDAENQHPIESITGLRKELDDKDRDIRALQELSGNIADLVAGAEETLEEIRNVQNGSVQAVLAAELAAHESISGSAKAVAENVEKAQELREEIQEKLDSGEFKGDPFTYKDFTEEQLDDLKRGVLDEALGLNRASETTFSEDGKTITETYEGGRTVTEFVSNDLITEKEYEDDVLISSKTTTFLADGTIKEEITK